MALSKILSIKGECAKNCKQNMDDRKPVYVVTKFRSTPETVSVYNETVKVMGEDYASLNSCSSAAAIEAGFTAIVRALQLQTRSQFKNLCFIRCTYVERLFKSTKLPSSFGLKAGLLPYNPNKFIYVLPLNESKNHWALLIINTKSESYYHFDSMENHSKSGQMKKMITTFIAHLNQLYCNMKDTPISVDSWVNETPSKIQHRQMVTVVAIL